ncbi:hypothetical protein LINGRAHAP2_LOCUS31233 [Linum grandiflorum]
MLSLVCKRRSWMVIKGFLVQIMLVRGRRNWLLPVANNFLTRSVINRCIPITRVAGRG